MSKFWKYLLGFRQLPLLMVGQAPGGGNSYGINDFFRFVCGHRGYIRVQGGDKNGSDSKNTGTES